MLNIFKLKLNKFKNIASSKKLIKNYPKDFPPSTREWKNSIYVYDKKALYLIPEASKLANRFIKSYFNLHNYKLERRIRREKILRRFRRLSSHKIYVSDGEFKHTNNKVLITLYIYNKQSANFLTKIYKIYTFKFNIIERILKFRLNRIRYNLKKINSKYINLTSIFNKFVNSSQRKTKLLNAKENKFLFYKIKTSNLEFKYVNPLHNTNKYINYIKFKLEDTKFVLRHKPLFGFINNMPVNAKLNSYINYDYNYNSKSTKENLKHNTIKIGLKKYKYIESLNKFNLNLLSKKKKRLVTNNIKYKYYLNRFFEKYKNNSLKRFKRYFLYRHLLYINKTKFNYTYIRHLINMIKKIYNKNVEFNLVNIKYFYYNSDILSQAITSKVKRNRKRLLRILKRSIRKIKIRRRYWANLYNKRDARLFIPRTKDDINKTIYKNFYKNQIKNPLKKTVLDLIKYKEITGIRLEAKGRLTRRYTASRSKHKVRYKGNLKNTDSSYHGKPSVILRGNTRSNLQFSKYKSKTRIGSFGIKGWVSGT